MFLQVDNRPCSQVQFTCFPYASEAADFLNAVLELNRAPTYIKPEIQALISIRGINKEIAVIEPPVKDPDGMFRDTRSRMFSFFSFLFSTFVSFAFSKIFYKTAT